MIHASILSIAGSDSCSGAGVQIDIKTAMALGVHATCALTAVTAQNTLHVTGIAPMDASMVRMQIDAAFEDVAPSAIKIGMLGSIDVAQTVLQCLQAHPQIPVVLDPVLVATSGSTLSTDDVARFIADSLLPCATVVTPNLPEALALTGIQVVDQPSANAAADVLLEKGAQSVLLKGGHGTGDVLVDHFFQRTADAVVSTSFTSQRLPGEFHGTGCCLSTAIACYLAQGCSAADAVVSAREFLLSTLSNPTGLGAGSNIIWPTACKCDDPTEQELR